MPTGPELRRIGREVGQVEIEHEIEAHDLRYAARDVGIPGEIAIDLKRKGINADQRVKAVRRIGGEHLVDDGGQVVGDKDFLEVSPEDQVDAFGDLGGGDDAGTYDLGKQAVSSLDRTCH